MTREELSQEIQRIADSCDDSRSQQCVKSILYGLLGAIAGLQEEQMMDHSCEFSRHMIRDIERQRFNSKVGLN